MRNLTAKFNLIMKESGLYRTQIPKIVIIILIMRIAAITKNGNQYKQYWYHYEFWHSGDRVTKKSRYIPKNKVSKVERMNSEKVPVEKILKVLKSRSKRKQ